jgi:LacI family transcriptional regulator/LacI family repressor for deo operon, udp, cdd, tsx, nupC, and nupG
MPVTIKDIAKAAGVSHTTVSRALRGNPSISNNTIARIEQLAKDMGYVPSAVAQSLHAQQTLTIGVVVTTIADPFIVKVVEGIEGVAQAAGYSVFLSTSNNDPDRELAVVETFRRRRVDAIIVTSSRVGRLYSSQLDQVEVPIVLINNQEEGKYLYSVAIDDEQGAELAVRHLLECGHRRIAYIGVPDRPKSNERRLAGYQAALEQANITSDPDLLFSPNAADDFQRGQAALEAIKSARATAAFAGVEAHVAPVAGERREVADEVPLSAGGMDADPLCTALERVGGEGRGQAERGQDSAQELRVASHRGVLRVGTAVVAAHFPTRDPWVP